MSYYCSMKKYIKPALWALAGLFVLAQFIRPEKNQSNEHPAHIRNRFPAPENVETILQAACYDCHSNNTRYPWYTGIQPVAAWIANHVAEGKRELNFSEFTSRRIAIQNHKLEEVIELVRKQEMPLASYTWIHADARLSTPQKNALIAWAQAAMDTIKAQYPADSLVLRRKRR